MTGTDHSCERCGDDFRVEACVVDRPAPDADVGRERIEAYLCYSCRSDTPHERLATDGGAVQPTPPAETHINQNPPYEWSAMEHDGTTYIARDVPEGTADIHVVEGATRNLRVLATDSYAIYEGNVVRIYYDDDFRGVEFIHDFAGSMGCHAVEEWLDEPAIRLTKLISGTGDLVEVIEA